jgi:BlaI family transcriptional regulator, penicillinase repressor
MGSRTENQLSRRERQIMDILYECKECSAHEVRDHMPDAPSYSAVRALLAKLLEKGHVEHKQDGARYIYFPCQDMSNAQESALQRVVKTFFGGSRIQAVNALLGLGSDELDEKELSELTKLVQGAKKNSDAS